MLQSFGNGVIKKKSFNPGESSEVHFRLWRYVIFMNANFKSAGDVSVFC